MTSTVDSDLGDRSTATARATAPGELLAAIVVVGTAVRIWWAAANGTSFDESFTAVAARRPFGDLLAFLRDHDSHPPLDYALRAPLARLGLSDLALRAPSLAFSLAALALFAWWMRTRPLPVAVTATAVMALSPFQITYGSEARMYALLELLGVAAAVVSERFLRCPRRSDPWWIGLIVLIAMFDHVSGLLLAAGALAVPGVRRDHDAWRWRATVGGAGLVWALTWGPSFVRQRAASPAAWIPRTTVWRAAEAIGAQVTGTAALELLLAAMAIVGCTALARRDRTLARVIVTCAVVPFALAAIVGVFAPFFLDRTFTVAAWAPPLALGVLVDVAGRRHRFGYAVAALVIGLCVVPGTVVFLARRWEVDASVARIDEVVRSGDVVATTPAWYSPLVEWRVVDHGAWPVRRVVVRGVPDAEAWKLGRGTLRRAWVLSFAGFPPDYRGFERCAPDWTDGETTLSCLRLAAR